MGEVARGLLHLSRETARYCSETTRDKAWWIAVTHTIRIPPVFSVQLVPTRHFPLTGNGRSSSPGGIQEQIPLREGTLGLVIVDVQKGHMQEQRKLQRGHQPASEEGIPSGYGGFRGETW
ncbi:hypothetical protein GWK47_043405 [Chionoecetes opilio]|uniref:Uncharacterized protein n=1 Tax=Chionoecetes opilio TaxID=41210 RepID=A0A8J4YAC9_CHIOP|nr:hypothetical protein GWK47_043405 [Chionoecetes opilio]